MHRYVHGSLVTWLHSSVGRPSRRHWALSTKSMNSNQFFSKCYSRGAPTWVWFNYHKLKCWHQHVKIFLLLLFSLLFLLCLFSFLEVLINIILKTPDIEVEKRDRTTVRSPQPRFLHITGTSCRTQWSSSLILRRKRQRKNRKRTHSPCRLCWFPVAPGWSLSRWSQWENPHQFPGPVIGSRDSATEVLLVTHVFLLPSSRKLSNTGVYCNPPAHTVAKFLLFWKCFPRPEKGQPSGPNQGSNSKLYDPQSRAEYDSGGPQNLAVTPGLEQCHTRISWTQTGRPFQKCEYKLLNKEI